MKRYGLQLRIPSGQKKKPEPSKAPLRPSVFGDDDEDDVEREISRQASKTRALQKIEEQHRKTLAEDPSVFDYDGVYDEMKEQIARPRVQDRSEKKSKYIETLMIKAKEREREHEIIYEKKLLKERNKDDHLFADKEKFVTSAYKKKLAEQEKWLVEERLRQIREEKEDVTKKSDLSDFYFSLHKNISFGAESKEKKTPKTQGAIAAPQEIEDTQTTTEARTNSSQDREEVDNGVKISPHSETESELEVKTSEVIVADATSAQEKSKEGQRLTNQLPSEHYKRSEDAVTAARERYLARKKAREQ